MLVRKRLTNIMKIVYIKRVQLAMEVLGVVIKCVCVLVVLTQSL